MLRFTEAEFQSRVQARMRGKVSADQVVPIGSPDISWQAIGCAPEAITGRIDAPAHKQEGRMVMLPYPISANRYWRNFRGRMVVSSEAKTYKAKVAWSFSAYGVEPAKGDVAITVILHPRLTKKGVASRTCIDMDNSLKVIFDALQGVLYVNDKQIKELWAKVGEPVAGGGLSVGIA